MHSARSRGRRPSFAAASTFVVGTILLSACVRASVRPTSAPPSPASPAASSPAQIPDNPSEPPAATQAAFPLAGTWTGAAQNGGLTMDLAIDLLASCQVGAVCGRYKLSLPCTGEFSLVGERDGVYEFQAGRKSAGCTGEGRDFLQLLPDGSLQYSSRGVYGETRGTLVRNEARDATPDSAQPIPLYDDDDGSPDGTSALLYLLLQPSVDLKAAGISYGEAHPSVYIQHIGRMLDYYGFREIPLGAGIDASLSGNEGFPEWLRQAAAGF